MATVLEKIHKSVPLDDQVYSQIKRAILDGTLEPGTAITESQLATSLGVSRTPIRKAVPRLEQEGFIVDVPLKGYQVAGISSRDIHETYQLREIVECQLVRETAPFLTPEELDEMEDLLNQADGALKKNDHQKFLDASRMFHHSFDRKYGNRRISELLSSLDEHVYRFVSIHLKNQRVQTSLAFTIREHRQILQAIRKGDVEGAVALTREHLTRYRLLIGAE